MSVPVSRLHLMGMCFVNSSSHYCDQIMDTQQLQGERVFGAHSSKEYKPVVGVTDPQH